MAKKIQVHADDFVKDVRDGHTDDELRAKYGLSLKQYQSLLERLLDTGRLEPSDLEDHLTAYEATVELASTCPACGALKLIDSETCPHCDAKTTVPRIHMEEEQTVRLPREELPQSESEGYELPEEAVSFEWGDDSAEKPVGEAEGVDEVQLADEWKDDWNEGWEETAADKRPFVEGQTSRRPRRKRRNRVLLAVGQLAVAIMILTAIGFYTELIPLPGALKSDAPEIKKKDRPKVAGARAKREKSKPRPKTRKPRSMRQASRKKDLQAPRSKLSKKAGSPARQAKRKPRSKRIARAEKSVKPVKESPPRPAKPLLETGSKKNQDSKKVGPEKAVKRQKLVQSRKAKPSLKRKPSRTPARSPAKTTAAVRPKKAAAEQDHPAGLKKDRDLQTRQEPKPADPLRLTLKDEHRQRIASLPKEKRLPGDSQDYGKALIHGVKIGDTQRVQLLLEKGANANIKDVDGDSALIIASREGKQAMVSLLLKSGADPTLKNAKGSTAISEASEAGRTRVLRLLLAHDKRKGRTELLAAAAQGRIKVVTSLVVNGADINARDDRGNTCLMLAAASGNLKMVTLLLGLGADVQAIDQLGHNALTMASFPPPSKAIVPLKDRRQIVRVLKAHARRKRGPIQAR